MTERIRSVMENLRQMPTASDLEYGIRKLEGIRDWAMDQIGIDYRVGDQVAICSPTPSRTGGGWAHYAECLEEGRTGSVLSIDFNLHRKTWVALFRPDQEWATSLAFGVDSAKRYWHGSLDSTPEGYEPPSKVDQEHYPDGRKHTFMFDVSWLRGIG